MSNTQFVHIPFNAGQNDAVSRKMMPDGLFRRVVNGDLDAAGALTIRQGFSPLTMLSYAGALEAFDLYSVDESLVALGADILDAPHDLFVYNNEVPANPWRGTTSPSITGGTLAATQVQRVGGDPYRAAVLQHASIAVNTNGLVGTTSSANIGSNTEATVHIFDPETDETWYLTSRLGATPQATQIIALGSAFGLIVSTGAATLFLSSQATNVAPTAATFATSVGNLATDCNFSSGFQALTDATRIHLLYRRTSDGAVVYKQFTHAGVQNGSTKIVKAADNGGAPFGMAITATQVVTAVAVSAGATGLELTSFGISSPFTTATGPTTLLGASQLSSISVGIGKNSDILLLVNTTSTMEFLLRTSTHTGSIGSTYTQGFRAAGDIVLSGDHIIAPVFHRWGPPTQDDTAAILDFGNVGSGSALGGRVHDVLWYEDRTIARFQGGGGRTGFNVVQFGDWTYVLQGFRDQNLSESLVVRRAKFNSTGRRQGVMLGNLFYLAGGQVTVFDGVQNVESGMAPPRIVNVSGGTAGALTVLGTYKWRTVAEWVDRKGNLHLSPVSAEATAGLAGAQDSAILTVAVPPTLRATAQGASLATGLKISVYRTETTVEHAPARLLVPTSTVPAGSLAGFFLDVTVDGGAPVGVSFGALNFTPETIGALIIGVVPGLTFEVVNGQLFLVTVSEGANSSIEVNNLTGPPFAGPVLGLPDGTTALGTTESEPGELFLFSTSAIVPTGTVLGETITIEDTTSDADLSDNAPLYTTGDRGAISGVLDFAPPLPATFAAATRDRLWLANSNELVQVSQRLFPNEAIAFAETNLVGPVGFAYQARITGRITGIAALDERVVVGTRDKLFLTGGEGPNYVGQGEFEVPIELPSEVGFYDFRSIVLSSEGLWFQGDVDKLYLMPRGGGVPVWAGEPVRSRLGGFISGAAITEGETPRVAFAVGDAARAVVRDITSQQWFEYALPATPARSFIEHRGRFYFVDGSGTVWAPSAFSDNGAVIPLTVEFGDFAPFGPNGQGRLRMVQFLGEFKSAASVKLEISYDGGGTFADCGTFSYTGLAADAPVRAQWFPAIQRGDRYTFRLTMTPTTVGQGIVFNAFTAGVIPSRGETKLGAALRK